MKHIVVYIHGKGGNAAEADYYKQFFANAEVIGFDYKAQTPREAEAEFVPYFNALREKYDKITLIANSIGAYFAFNTLTKKQVDEAIFISPVADMAALIENMMSSNGVSEAELCSKKNSRSWRRNALVEILLLRARTRTRVAHLSAHSRAHYLRRSRYAHPARKNACVRRKNRRKRRRDAGRRTLVSHTRANAVFIQRTHSVFR